MNNSNTSNPASLGQILVDVTEAWVDTPADIANKLSSSEIAAILEEIKGTLEAFDLSTDFETNEDAVTWEINVWPDTSFPRPRISVNYLG